MKNIKKLRIVAVFLMAALCLNMLSGCKSEQKFVLYMELGARPKTLDPQLANTAEEVTVVTALFEGLVRYDKNGQTVPAAAEQMELSSDQKTYTFHLRKNAEWSDGVAVTADDFVYGFLRALNKKTESPNAEKLGSILNANAAKNGDTKNFGATAIDKYTLKITLSYADDSFLNTLTQPVAMPCRQDFFNKCKGAYGLNKKSLVTNGSFKLYSWATDNSEKFTLRINRFAKYSGPVKAAAMATVFSLADQKQSKSLEKRLSLDNIDLCYSNENFDNKDIKTIELKNTVLALLINKNCKAGYGAMRTSLAKSIHRYRIKTDLGTAFNPYDYLLPDILKIGGKSVTDVCAFPAVPEYDPTAALAGYKKVAKENGAIDQTAILYYGEQNEKLAALLAENFQQSLSAYVNISAADSAEALLAAVKAKDYKLALVELKAENQNAADFLRNGITNGVFDGKIAKTLADYESADSSGKTNKINAALKQIAAETTVIPIAEKSQYLALNAQFSCPDYTAYSTILDLALVQKIK